MVRNTRGFTLLELMVVIIIVGILAAISVPKFLALSDKPKLSEGMAVAGAMLESAMRYNMEKGANPPTADDLDIGNPNTEHNDINAADPGTRRIDYALAAPATYNLHDTVGETVVTMVGVANSGNGIAGCTYRVNDNRIFSADPANPARCVKP